LLALKLHEFVTRAQFAPHHQALGGGSVYCSAKECFVEQIIRNRNMKDKGGSGLKLLMEEGEGLKLHPHHWSQLPNTPWCTAVDFVRIY
jgi:hypothetical protein